MDFDCVRSVRDDLKYGLIKGDGRIVFVKVGLGGDHLGYENRYLKMARLLHDSFGCSVIVASNPQDGQNHIEEDRSIIKEYVLDEGIEDSELLFFGHSNGCIKGLALTGVGVSFSKMVLVNMPLMINFHKTKGYIAANQKTDVVAVYGDLDPSYPYTPYIKDKFPNLRLVTAENTEHNFFRKTDEFINLSRFLFQ